MDRYVLHLLLLGTLVLPETWTGQCGGETGHGIRGSHSMRFFSTAMTWPGLREPRYLSVGYMDDQPFVRFDSHSESQRKEPIVPWMERMEPEYWDGQTRIHREYAERDLAHLETLRRYFNQSAGGVHTYQRMYGCEVTPELDFRRGFRQEAYDGRDYIALDTETYTWTAAVPQAENTKRKWEADKRIADDQKVYMEEICVTWLKKHLDMGKESLLRTDPPSARVTRHTAPNGEVILRCRAQDFYPADISLTWLRDGQEQLQDTEFIETRPSGDGTFQKWAAVEVTPGREGEYTCRVQHEGLPEPLTLQWGKDEPLSSPIRLTVGGIAAGLLFISVIAGFLIWRQKNSDRNGGDYALAAVGTDRA